MKGECECCGIEKELDYGRYVVHGRVFKGNVCKECYCSEKDIVEIFGVEEAENLLW